VSTPGDERDGGCQPRGAAVSQVPILSSGAPPGSVVQLLLVPVGMIIRLATAWLTSLLLLALTATPLHPQTLDPASTEALAATLKMLADPAMRSQVIGSSPAAAEADRKVQDLAGAKLAPEVYGLAAEVFSDLVQSSGGDPKRMSEALDLAKSDPAGFAAMLRPETLERLRALSVKISDSQR